MYYKILIIIATIIFMEGFAWFSHKYIMHGFMWFWHQSHHSKQKTVLEKNDLFSVIFAIFSVSFIVLGSEVYQFGVIFWIGIGILIYGILYFIFHDVIVHQRVKLNFSAKNTYLKRIIKAHHIHHKTFTKEGAEAFGFLYAIRKYASKK
jgi:beta-carotene 3-hydroxylase